MEEPLTVKKAFCAECGGLRNCDIRGGAVESWDDAGGAVWGRTNWFILQCRGCDHIFCQTIKIFSEDYSHEWDEAAQEDVLVHDETIAYWPAVSKRKAPDWFTPMGFAGDSLDVLYRAMGELYGALDNDLARLAAAGVRTVFDIASELLGVDANLTFKEKLDELVSSGRINGVDRDRLEALTEAGSASMHRGWVPTPPDLSTMVDILEHFVHRAFVMPILEQKLTEKSASLRKTVPARKPRKKSKKTNAKMYLPSMRSHVLSAAKLNSSRIRTRRCGSNIRTREVWDRA
jgi:hypothetical protein